MSKHGGTVYGKGGLDARPPRQGGLHPAVLALVGGAVLVLAVALVYWVVRDPAETPAGGPVAATSAAAAPAPATEEAAASPSPSGGARLTTGEWVLALAADPERRLREEDDFAAMTRDDPEVLRVVKGLGDDGCFSFRNDDGDYLRHFDYRLRFDERDDSELFRNDATFCAETAGDGVVLRSKNYPQHVMHRRGTQLYIDEPEDGERFRADSTFTVLEPAQ